MHYFRNSYNGVLTRFGCVEFKRTGFVFLSQKQNLRNFLWVSVLNEVLTQFDRFLFTVSFLTSQSAGANCEYEGLFCSRCHAVREHSQIGFGSGSFY